MTLERLRVESNERVDIDDFKHLAGDTAVGRTEQMIQEFICDSTSIPMSIIHGFKPEYSSGVKVTKGAAFLGYRSGSQARTGVIAAQGATDYTVDVSAYAAGLYNIYIRFEEVEASPETRLFWDNAGLGSEYAQTVSTRWEAQWGARVESTSPGAEWFKIGTYNTVGNVVTDTRVFYFEGDTANTYESGWSAEGGGVTNDRNSDRGLYGVQNLTEFVAATKQCIEDLKGRGLKRWWDKGIGGMNIGFDTDPTDDTLAVGDADFFLKNTGIGVPGLIYDVDGGGLSDALVYSRSTDTFTFMFADASTLGLTDSKLYPTGTNLDLGDSGNEWYNLYSVNGYFSGDVTVGDSDFKSSLSGSSAYIEFDDAGTASADYLRYDRVTNNLILGIDNVHIIACNDSMLYPSTTDAMDLGDLTHRWQTLYVETIAVDILAIATGTNHLIPTTTGIYDLGSSSKVWNDLFVTNIACEDITPHNIIPSLGIYELGSNVNHWFRAYISSLILTVQAAPGSPVEGEVYYDSGDHKLKVYTGSAWEEITSTP